MYIYILFEEINYKRLLDTTDLIETLTELKVNNCLVLCTRKKSGHALCKQVRKGVLSNDEMVIGSNPGCLYPSSHKSPDYSVAQEKTIVGYRYI